MKTSQDDSAQDVRSGAMTGQSALWDLVANGLMMVPALRAAVTLGIADLVADGPRGVADLAKSSGSDPSALHRLLRFLAGAGVFVETAPGVFGLNEASAHLRTGIPHSLAGYVGQDLVPPWTFETLRRLPSCVRTGQASLPEVCGGVSLWQYLSANPELGELFDRTVAALSAASADRTAENLDFPPGCLVADIGGGVGGLLLPILRAHQELRGILFDLPSVAERSRATVAAAGLVARCEVVAGDFFDAVPSADAYVLRHVLHDWDDESCVKILQNCRKASPRAPVRIVERVLGGGGTQEHFTRALDLIMLAYFPNARERDRDEYRTLLEAAGYRLQGVRETGSPFSILVGVPAEGAGAAR